MFKVTKFQQTLAASASLALLLASAPANAIDGSPAASTTTPVLAVTNNGDAPRRGFLGGIFGCESSGNKQVVGAVAGGAVGGLLGNVIAGRGSRALGTILGGALGAAAGSAIGCKLQKNDQQRAERAVQDAVATNKSQTWQSDETGASGKVDVSQAAGVNLADIKFASNVEPASAYSKVANVYVATAAANLRSAPATSAPSLGKLAIGQQVWVPAQVKGQPWMLVSTDGVAQGYVSAPLLKRSTAVASNSCKMVKNTVSVPGAADESETFQACKGGDGNWVMTRV
jgi:surface antigen